MEQIPRFNALIQKSIIDNWDRDALTDYKGQTLQFHDDGQFFRTFLYIILHMLFPEIFGVFFPI